VAAGANCSISVTFIPTATGTRTGAITISDNASDSPQMVNLTGTGTSGGVPGTIGFVQARGNGTNATTNTVLINTTASNDVIVVVAFATTTPRVTSVSDTGGSTYTLIAAVNKGSGARVEKWAAHRAAASTAITVNLSALAKSRVEVAEYSGVVTLGLTALKTGSGASLSIALTTQSANSWVVAGFAEKNSTSFSPSIGNLRDSGSFTISGTTVGGAVNDNTAANPLSVTNAVTTNATGLWAAAALELPLS